MYATVRYASSLSDTVAPNSNINAENTDKYDNRIKANVILYASVPSFKEISQFVIVITGMPILDQIIINNTMHDKKNKTAHALLRDIKIQTIPHNSRAPR